MIERFETFTTNIASIYKNIVKIKKYTSDKRKYRAKVILTPKGISYAQKVNAAINNAVSFGGSDLSDETRTVFYSALKTISANLEQYCDELERNDEHE